MEHGEHGEGELEGEDDLAEGEEVGDAAVAAEADDEDGGEDGEGTGDEATEPGGDAPVHEAFHDDLSGEGAGDGGALPAGEEGDGEEGAGGGDTEEGGEGEVGHADPVGVVVEGDDLAAGDGDAVLSKEDHGGEDEDGGVDEEGDGEGDDGVDGIEADGAADGGLVFLEVAALDEGGVEVEIVGHDGGADDADGDVEHAGLAEVGGDEGAAHFEEAGLGLGEDEDFDEVADGDGGDEEEDDGLDGTHAEALEGEEEEDIGAGDDDGPEEGDMEEEVEGDGAAEDFGEIAGADGDFTEEPVGPACPAGVPVAAALGEVPAGDDAEARGDDLHEDGHDGGECDDPEESEFELGAALEVGAPVAGVHVADGDEDGGSDEGAPLAPEAGGVMGDVDGGMHAFEGGVSGVGG